MEPICCCIVCISFRALRVCSLAKPALSRNAHVAVLPYLVLAIMLSFDWLDNRVVWCGAAAATAAAATYLACRRSMREEHPQISKGSNVKRPVAAAQTSVALDGVLGAIGNTPLIRIRSLSEATGAPLCTSAVHLLCLSHICASLSGTAHRRPTELQLQ